MNSTIAAVAAGIVILFASAMDAEACSRNVSAKAAKTVVPSSRVNQALLDDAIRAEVNFHRCRAGLRTLADAGSGLANQAKKHSSWMARSQQLTHRSTVAGSATLKQRLKKSGLRYRTGAENIGMVHRYQIDNQRFKIVNSNACQFTTYGGQPLPAHSYASLARHVVDLWMNSPGHRKNILNRKVTKMSSGVAFDPKAQYCGRFWLTQNFVG
ncbi:MAG: CAP domain-containing protein [Boseongicola sp.]